MRPMTTSLSVKAKAPEASNTTMSRSAMPFMPLCTISSLLCFVCTLFTPRPVGPRGHPTRYMGLLLRSPRLGVRPLSCPPKGETGSARIPPTRQGLHHEHIMANETALTHARDNARIHMFDADLSRDRYRGYRRWSSLWPLETARPGIMTSPPLSSQRNGYRRVNGSDESSR